MEQGTHGIDDGDEHSVDVPLFKFLGVGQVTVDDIFVCFQPGQLFVADANDTGMVIGFPTVLVLTFDYFVQENLSRGVRHRPGFEFLNFCFVSVFNHNILW